MNELPYKRHWSFVVTDLRYLYPLVLLLLAGGVTAALLWKDATYVSRMGNFIIGTGVWMSMRYTLREGIKRDKSRPPIPKSSGPGQPIDSYPINQAIFTIGDALLQVHGFALVLVGSFVGSFGDLLFKVLLSAIFR